MSGLDDEFLTVAEIAGILKLNQQTIRNWIDQGSLPALRVGTEGARPPLGLRGAAGAQPHRNPARGGSVKRTRLRRRAPLRAKSRCEGRRRSGERRRWRPAPPSAPLWPDGGASSAGPTVVWIQPT